jgi:hypothetical protein
VVEIRHVQALPTAGPAVPRLRFDRVKCTGGTCRVPVERSATLASTVRIGVFHNAPYYLRYYVPTLEVLLERGHRVLLTRPDLYDEVRVPRSMRTNDHVTTALYPNSRADGLDRSLRIMRSTRDFGRYAAPPLRIAEANRRRAYERLLRSVVGKARSLAYDGPVVAPDLDEAEHATLDRLFGGLEALIPPDEGLRSFIRDHRLDVVVCVSRVNFAARQTEVVKAAKSLGVPVGVVVYSWDNLSSKGLLHEHPDRLFVWNDVQAHEAETLHGIDPGSIAVTGAVRFDPVFESAPSADRAALLEELSLDPARRTLLWLGSSAFVAPREPEIVGDWIAALRASGDELIRDANVIVRPHPGTTDEPVWTGWSPSDERTVVPPPVVRRRAQDLIDQLTASDAVVGLNTSAEIEAAIVDRPVLTVKVGGLAPGQEGSVHFDYLLDGEGGFVETARSFEEHLVQLGRALRDDPHRDARQRFLESFVRPHGLETPAASVLADSIETLAQGRRRRLGVRLRSSG